MSLAEFDIIANYFQNGNKRKDVLLGIGDDCAILSPPANKKLLASIDTLNIGSHFFTHTHPFDIGYKSVAVSLSDLASMGGEPAWLMVALTLPKVDKFWLEHFSEGLFTCMKPFNVELVGGNLSKGPLAITTQIMGFVDVHTKLTRNNAKVNDLIYVTGCLGDAGLALAILENQIEPSLFSTAEITQLTERLWRPPPRIYEGQLISQFANAAIDISDGLLADLNHILNQSHVGATLYAHQLPLSSNLKKITEKQRYPFLLGAGDDYELCFTISPDSINDLEILMQQMGYHFTCIGAIDAELGLRVKNESGEFINLETKGYQHF